MALGVRSYGSSLRMQNIFNPEALPDTDMRIKDFAQRILIPNFQCVEHDCGTRIGRRIEIPEQKAEGLLSLGDSHVIVEEDVIEELVSGGTFVRVRDSVACLSEGGHCELCGNGYKARTESEGSMSVGNYYQMPTSTRSFQNYIANSYSGSIVGFSPLASDPLAAPGVKWINITNHEEMDRICSRLEALKVNVDELEYLYTISDILERALAIIATYGVYGNA